MEYLQNAPLSPKFSPVHSHVAFCLLKGDLGMGSLLIVVIKLPRIKYGDVLNLQNIKYLYDYFRHSLTRVTTI